MKAEVPPEGSTCPLEATYEANDCRLLLTSLTYRSSVTPMRSESDEA